MSHNLARLRSLFGDELLTRSPEGMRLTPRALPRRSGADRARRYRGAGHRADTFDPRTAERVFRIGLPDSVEVLVGPKLLARVWPGGARHSLPLLLDGCAPAAR